MILVNYLRELNLISIMFRLILAAILGGTIGFDRGRIGRAAGLRTHILVCVGASLVMMTNQYIIQYMDIGGDPSRLGAQVISGIGFLGAGTIIVTKQQVKGLTTAAGLWASACMGLAIGIGFYEGAIIGYIFIFLGIKTLYKIDNYFLSKSNILDLYIEINSVDTISIILKQLKQINIEILSAEAVKSDDKIGKIGLFINIRQPKNYKHNTSIAIITAIEDVSFIQEIKM